MTSNHSRTPTREAMDSVSVQGPFSSAVHEQRVAIGMSHSEAEEREPRIWKVMAMRRELHKGHYKVSTAELADALLGLCRDTV